LVVLLLSPRTASVDCLRKVFSTRASSIPKLDL
jgi:hypothetical protein